VPRFVVGMVDVQGATSLATPSAGQSPITSVVPLMIWPARPESGEMSSGLGVMS
jgi:hypothetical protein